MSPLVSKGRSLALLSVVTFGVSAGACSDDAGGVAQTSAHLAAGTTGVIKGLAGKCLDSGGTENNARAALWQCNGSINQQWTLTDGQIVGPNGKCLDAAKNVSDDGTPLELWTCHGGSNQSWSFVASGAAAADGGAGDTDSGAGDIDAGAGAGDTATGTADATPPPPPSTATRDPLAWPFASTSVWNMPIGSGALFAEAYLSDDPEGDPWAPMPQIDDEVIVLRPSAPSTAIDYSSAGWSGADRCAATGGYLTSVPMPSDYLVPNGPGNLGAAFLLGDGRTIRQLQPLARCSVGGRGTAIITFPDVDLFGDGILGAHGGSEMSSIGGSLRMGELRPGGTGPRHALKVDVDSPIELHRCPSFGDCYRWPALTADSGAEYSYGSRNANASPAMKMGALLAIPGSVSLGSLGFETEPGKMLAWTFQNYGAYIVDTTGGPSFTISSETGPDGVFRDQFASDWGFPLEQRVRDATPWVRDIQRIRRALRVVDNNGPNSVGGGGTPRQPLAPPL